MEHTPLKRPRIHTENEQSASSSSQIQFNSPPVHAGNYVATYASGSRLLPNQWIPPSPQQYLSSEPSRLPFQAWG